MKNLTPHHTDIDATIKAIKAEPDRVAVIVTNSYLEDYLGRAIKLNLPGCNSDLRDKLFGSSGILGSMSAKIDIARALNIIDAQNHNDYVVLNRIRNRFAHNIHIDSLEHPDILLLLQQLQIDGDTIDKLTGARTKFMHSAIGFIVALHNYYNNAFHAHKDGKLPWLPKSK
jgi:hypothetical protein